MEQFQFEYHGYTMSAEIIDGQLINIYALNYFIGADRVRLHLISDLVETFKISYMAIK